MSDVHSYEGYGGGRKEIGSLPLIPNSEEEGAEANIARLPRENGTRRAGGMRRSSQKKGKKRANNRRGYRK